MATMSRADSKGMYSWWWVSHISPKNSKWLQENLSDMDENIKKMIKLIEEDADSFAQRAEMYYMKRPDLLRLVEEFYRAYRALAERYDHATGFLRQAHNCVAEVFPDQVPSSLDDPVLAAASSEHEDMLLDGEFNADFLGQLLKGELTRLEAQADKEIKMAKVIECAQAEALKVKEELKRVEEEKEVVMDQYEMSLETISCLEKKLAELNQSILEVTERSIRVEIEMEILKQALEKMMEVKESTSLECRKLSTKVVELESLVEKMGEELTQKEEETGRLLSYGKQEHQKSLEVETALQSLQNLLFQSQEKMKILKSCNEDLLEQVKKADDESMTLKGLNLSSSLLIDSLRGESISLKEIIRNLEKEVKIQVEERNVLHQEISLFKNKFDTLKEKYQLVMEQVQSVGLDPEGVSSYVKKLQDEISKLREYSDQKLRENESLLEENVLLEISISDLNSHLDEVKQKLQDEQLKLMDLYDEKLREHVSLHKKNTFLENSLSCLNEELEEVKWKLQDEKFKMMKYSEETLRENEDLLRKNAFLENSVSDLNSELEVVKQNLEDEKARPRELYDDIMRRDAALLEKNALMENSLSYSNKALGEVQQKLKASEESWASLTSQLRIANENLERLQRKCVDTQNVLYNAKAENDRLRIMLKKSEDLWLLILNEKLALITEKESLSYQLDLTKRRLEDSLLRSKDLERKCLSFDRETAENAINAELSRTRVAVLESQVLLLKQEGLSRNRELMDKLEKALNNHLEMFIMKNCMQDLEEKNSSLTFDCWNFMRACESSERQRLTHEKSMSEKVQELQKFLWKTMDDNIQLNVEKSVLSIVIGEMHMEAKKIAIEREIIYEDLKVQCENYELSLNLLHEETGEVKLREQNLLCDLQKEIHEVELWEAQATDYFCKMMSLNFQEVILEEKVREFIQSKTKECELLGKRIRFLEGENTRLMSMFDIHTAVEVPLKDWAESQKNCTSIQECLSADDKGCRRNHEQLRADGGEIQDIKLVTHFQSTTDPLEETARHTQRTEPEHSNSGFKLGDKMRKIEGLRPKHHNLYQGNDPKNGLASRRNEVMVYTNRHVKKQAQHPVHPKPEALTKDIVLDQVSDSSTFRSNQRENFIGSDERMLELWEATNFSRSIDLKVGVSQKAVHPSRKSFLGKELGVDNMEASEKSSSEHCPGKKLRRLVERLDTDAQKLTNLQITVQDLKRKVETAERSRMGRAAEYMTVKEQLEEAEMEALNLFDVNHKLTKRVQGFFLSRSSGIEMNSGDHTSGIRRKISEQARRGSGEIADLQLKVQKIQLLLWKMDDEVEKENRGGLRTARVSERKTGVLLKDLLHVRMRSNLKRKKGQCCACVYLPTRAK
ncbi:hypothetical protein SAY86_023389 [Trapa natans]|uniref:NAB domain-containing protein n=1 Tax=Trapa natans TaxID=22666 RepID=A0AAN7LVP6_TRANT|nr:hypothetical protein SAY86_023389 [Trapa natans]